MMRRSVMRGERGHEETNSKFAQSDRNGEEEEARERSYAVAVSVERKNLSSVTRQEQGLVRSHEQRGRT